MEGNEEKRTCRTDRWRLESCLWNKMSIFGTQCDITLFIYLFIFYFICITDDDKPNLDSFIILVVYNHFNTPSIRCLWLKWNAWLLLSREPIGVKVHIRHFASIIARQHKFYTFYQPRRHVLCGFCSAYCVQINISAQYIPIGSRLFRPPVLMPENSESLRYFNTMPWFGCHEDWKPQNSFFFYLYFLFLPTIGQTHALHTSFFSESSFFLDCPGVFPHSWQLSDRFLKITVRLPHQRRCFPWATGFPERTARASLRILQITRFILGDIHI